ncbi:hypothetical protein B0T14DRAFT_386705, partial [Immersiella caudata]
SACVNTTCPQIFATASFSIPPTTFLFARGTNFEMWYRSFTNNTWTARWASLGGTFLSSPRAVSVRDGRIDVFAVSDKDQGPYSKTYQTGAWAGKWTPLSSGSNDRMLSEISVCSRGLDNIHVVTLNGSNVAFHKWTDDGVVWRPQQKTWDMIGGYSNSTVEVGCTEETVDLVAYLRKSGGGYGMAIKRRKGTAWVGWSEASGSYKGNPTIIEGAEGAELFGVAEDGSVRWRQWKAGMNESIGEEKNLGGTFMSAVEAVRTSKDRLDIFAVWTDARLRHRARIGAVWGEWNDLGGFFNSAPKAVSIREGEVVVFGLGPNSTVIH